MREELTQRTARLIGQAAVDLLDQKTVLVFGLGGVGSFATEALARAGIGRMILVDADVFDPSNVNRQLGAMVDTVGQRKIDVMAQRLKRINPDIRVETHNMFYLPEQQVGFVAASEADYIVDAIDTVSGKIGIIEEACQAGIPIISAMGAGNKLHPELFEIADIEKTSVCPMAKILRRELRKRGIRHIKVVYSKEPPRPVPIPADGSRPSPGSISFVPSVAGLIMAGAVIRDLTGLE
jgi:tRNA A37 threonylcarbamoyladenosine dehydratase